MLTSGKEQKQNISIEQLTCHAFVHLDVVLNFVLHIQ
jgi:hypothetical protein